MGSHSACMNSDRSLMNPPSSCVPVSFTHITGTATSSQQRPLAKPRILTPDYPRRFANSSFRLGSPCSPWKRVLGCPHSRGMALKLHSLPQDVTENHTLSLGCRCLTAEVCRVCLSVLLCLRSLSHQSRPYLHPLYSPFTGLELPDLLGIILGL